MWRCEAHALPPQQIYMYTVCMPRPLTPCLFKQDLVVDRGPVVTQACPSTSLSSLPTPQSH